MKKSVCVIGGGASGIMAALAAAKAGAKVMIIEHRDRIGKKIMLTGNGKCNLTNLNMDTASFHTSGSTELIARVLERFNQESLLDLFEDLGMRTLVNKESYVYPESEAAATVVEVLHRALKKYGVDIIYEVHAEKIDLPTKDKNIFVLRTNKQSFCADALIFACGGKSFPKTGSDGTGIKVLSKIGVPVIYDYPALTALVSDREGIQKLSGIRANAGVTLYVDGVLTATDTGQVQFTEYGLSGIPVFQISTPASIALQNNKKAEVFVNLFPEISAKEVAQLIKKQFEKFPGLPFEEAMTGFLHKKWTHYIAEYFKLQKYKTVSSLEDDLIKRIAREICAMQFSVTGVKGYDFCQVTGGGVSLDTVDEYLQVKTIPGLYVVGEMLDVTGKCGGYNLQWAFSTGYIAGTHSAE